MAAHRLTVASSSILISSAVKKAPLRLTILSSHRIHCHLAPQIWKRSNSSAAGNPALEAPTGVRGSRQLSQVEPRLQMTFTCTADSCGHRSSHEFAKKSYEKGIVLVQCPSCKARHLIADHLGWFKESMEGGKLKNVEDILRTRGEKVKRGKVNFDGDIEIEGE
ncbi:hypothetical protein L204_101056 [Cryptococcus depauperatus]|nr:hypothetical protein L204_01016 [Cryptococcus depauperatus CBS 7855]